MTTSTDRLTGPPQWTVIIPFDTTLGGGLLTGGPNEDSAKLPHAEAVPLKLTFETGGLGAAVPLPRTESQPWPFQPVAVMLKNIP